MKFVIPAVGLCGTALLAGCGTYRKMPLSQGTALRALQAPNLKAVRIHAERIQHPILKPLEIDLHDGLSPDEAAVLAVLANPALVAVRDQRGIAHAQVLQARVLPNPNFGYSLDLPSGGSTSGTVRGYGFTADWGVRSLLTRAPRVAAARSISAAVDLTVAWQEWQVAQAAKLHVLRLVFLAQQLRVARQEEKGLRENYEAVKRATDMGDMTVIDLGAAETALRRANTLVIALEKEQEQERLTLNAALGLPPQENIPIQAGITPSIPQPLPVTDELVEGIENRRLDLLALRAGYESQEERLRAAVRAQFPRIGLGLAQLRDTGNVVTSGFAVSVSLPFFDRNQGVIAIEDATRTQLYDDYLSRLFDARAQIASVLANLHSVQEQAEATDKAIQSLRGLVQTSYRGLLEGNVDVLSYYNTRQQLIARELEALTLRRDQAELGIALELASGRYLSQSTLGRPTP